jgi:predicted ATPase with chaperone activity
MDTIFTPSGSDIGKFGDLGRATEPFAPVVVNPTGVDEASERWASSSSSDVDARTSAPPPPEPTTLGDTGLVHAQVESLVLKVLLQRGNTTGSSIAEILCLHRGIIAETLDQLRNDLLVTIKTASGMNDFIYQLSDAGFERAQRFASRCNYVGAAPVVLDEYVESVRKQSLQNTKLDLNRLRRAFSDLMIRPTLVSQLAQSINDGRGVFLYGAPGNGKTSIAERVSNAFSQDVWIPRIISVHGELLRLYDPSCHEAVKSPELDATRYDRRWVLIRRPTVLVGGELTLDYLETRFNSAAGITEAPVQMKSNCGTLVIDDFGRQRVSSTDILNRLIVPLEKHYDFLYLASGRQIQVPFDQLLILSTNLEPRDLLDEAFLRRIPYKIEIGSPTEDELRQLIEVQANAMKFQYYDGAVDHLLEQHYRRAHRPMRFCHARDLLRQIKNYCEVHNHPKELTPEAFDMAVQNYFGSL